MSILGTRVARTEDPKLLTAGGSYVDDLREPALEGAAYVTYVRSPLAHARITGIDVDEARDVPGVVGVFTGADVDVPPAPGTGLQGKVHESIAQPSLAVDVVRFVGEPVAAVITETRAAGEDASELVSVDYDPLTPVVDVDDAMRGDTLLFPEAGSNVVGEAGGEPDGHLFAGCDVVASRTIENQRLAPAPLEVRGAACAWGDDGRLTMWLSTQNAQLSGSAIRKALGLSKEQLRVITPDVGGGFGAKIGVDPDAVFLGWLSRQTGRALRWTESRSENMIAMSHGRGQRQTITIGGNRDGRVLAYRLDTTQNTGAYPRDGAWLPNLTTMMAGGAYDIPKIETRARSVVTNTTSVNAYRGAGRPEATAAIERAMDLFAAEIEMDPAEVRRRNLVADEAFPYTTHSGVVYDSGAYTKALDTALQHAGYEGLRAEQARRRAGGDTILLGLGLSTYVEITAPDYNAGEHARVEIHVDGSATAYTGSSPQGQGHDTSFAMLVSDRLGIPMERISVVHGDTDRVPRGMGTMGSRSLQLGGTAIYQASLDVIEQARKLAAQRLEIAEEDLILDTDSGRWHVRGDPSSDVSWGDLAAETDGLAADSKFTPDQPTFPFGAHLAVVEVDTETGKTRLRQFVAVDDAGRILNPVITEGQRHGGIAQGAAQALFEEMGYDAEGNPVTASFADYEFPSAAEFPSFDLVPMETETPLNPLGAKGIGEAATIGSTPAVGNAVVDGLAHLGVRHIDMPATPQRVWTAITGATA